MGFWLQVANREEEDGGAQDERTSISFPGGSSKLRAAEAFLGPLKKHNKMEDCKIVCAHHKAKCICFLQQQQQLRKPRNFRFTLKSNVYCH